MSSSTDFLAPVSEAEPCGADVSYQPEFLELDSLILGKPETQFSEAVKPDWKLIAERCQELMAVSKHLRVGTIFVLASLQTGGLPGMGQAMELLAGWLRLYWETIYPRLDPDDNLDPLERMNILSSLTSPIATFGDSFRFLERLSEAPLTHSPTMGKLSLQDIQKADAAKSEPGSPAHSAEVAAAFRDTPAERLHELWDGLEQGKAGVKDMAAFLEGIGIIDAAPSFSLLLDQLALLEKQLAPYVTTACPELDDSPASEKLLLAPQPTSGIQSRSDVVRMLDLICAYYADHEPSSPIPLLLQRARRLVHSGFLEILAEIAPDSLTQVRTATGAAQEKD